MSSKQCHQTDVILTGAAFQAKGRISRVLGAERQPNCTITAHRRERARRGL
jgi:hypothetical protein